MNDNNDRLTVRQRRRRKVRYEWIGILLFLLIFLAVLIYAIIRFNTPELITITPENVTIKQGEDLPAFKASVTYSGKNGSRMLDKSKKLTVSKLVSELKDGKYYKLSANVDTAVDNSYPLKVELDDSLAGQLTKEYKHKLKIQIKIGEVVVQNTKGAWEGETRFKLNDGSYLAGDFLASRGNTYYFNNDGIKVTEDTQIGLKVVHFDKSGVMTGTDDEVKIDPSKPMLALTFDDGPGERTEELVNLLNKYNVHATFFVQGMNVARRPEAVKMAFDSGHEIGNHSYNHPDLAKLPAAQIQSQISRTNDEIKKATGQMPTVMRPPYGSVNATVRSAAGMPLIFWSVDTLDWKTRNVDSNIKEVLDNAGDGEIILMHDIHDASVDSVYTYLPELLRRGYQLVTINELAAARGITLKNGTTYESLKSE